MLTEECLLHFWCHWMTKFRLGWDNYDSLYWIGYSLFRRYKSALKKHKYNVREMDDTFMESIQRDSAILSISSSVPGLQVSSVVSGLPHVVQSNNGSLRFSDEIKGGAWIVMSATPLHYVWSNTSFCVCMLKCLVQLKCTQFFSQTCQAIWLHHWNVAFVWTGYYQYTS